MSDERFEELDEQQRALALRLRAVLRDSETLDPIAARRLSQARALAVAHTAAVRAPAFWLYGGVAAAGVLAALLLLFAPLQTRAPDANEIAASDTIDLLTDDVDPDFYEDLEMYRWLAQDGRA